MDYFHDKNLLPMSITSTLKAFDSKNYIFELKHEGVRCIAYLDENSTNLRSRENQSLNDRYPELLSINTHVKCKCILDGIIIIYKNGVTCFNAFDILYMNQHPIINLPLLERKKLLEKTIQISPEISVARFVRQHGLSMFYLARNHNISALIAKQVESRYLPGSTSKDWIRIDVSAYDYYVLCGYMVNESEKIFLILGQYRSSRLLFKGIIETPLDKNFTRQYHCKKANSSPFILTPVFQREVHWLTPSLVCKVKIRYGCEFEKDMLTFEEIISDMDATTCTEYRMML